jgi:hypothetical protein
MADAFEVLSADHSEVKQMMAEFEAGPHRVLEQPKRSSMAGARSPRT